MTEHPPDRIWSGIDIFKVTAGTFAAVSAAVVGSYLGVAGTLIGAALASIIGSVATEVYASSLNRGYTRLRAFRPVVAVPPATPVTGAASAEPTAVHGVRRPEPAPTVSKIAAHRPRWKKVALATAAIFVLAVGVISAVEVIAGRSLASIAGRPGGGTTIGSVGGDDGTAPAPAPTPTPDTSPGATTDPTATPTPDAQPTAEPAGTADPTTGPLEPTDPGPTAPAPTPPAG
jgi:hypothetical protein